MTKKRQPGSSVVSIMDEENLDLQDLDEEAGLSSGRDGVNYMNVDISTDNIEDIVTAKMDHKINLEDIYMINSQEEQEQSDFDLPKGVAVDDPVRL